MNDNINSLKNKFMEVKKMGWIESKRAGSTGIGYTFETIIGKPEENFELPDYKNIEIKTKNYFSRGKIKLFCATPDGDNLFAIQKLLEKCGYPDRELSDQKVFKGTVKSGKFSSIGTHYLFQLKVDRINKKIRLIIINRNYEIESNEISWSFDLLEEKVARKIQYLAIINAYQKKENSKVFYKYDNIHFYQLKSINSFIELIEKGTIQVNFNIGVFKQGPRTGQIHDHGTEFQIYEKDLQQLYSLIR